MDTVADIIRLKNVERNILKELEIGEMFENYPEYIQKRAH